MKEQADAPLDLRALRAQDEEELGSTTPGIPSHDAKNLPDPSPGLVPFVPIPPCHINTGDDFSLS